ncbi:MAG: phosphoesterase [Mobiluncus sp.]|uniref:phosphoesterase n=1 Tax=Mobiluncus sp. TaxID=47293 RepID=UPI00258A3E22|nr:phosphoesterase [Mobiluncus sp.]MCI6584641.1 phosphoesterase [Mobiluncus sp.]
MRDAGGLLWLPLVEVAQMFGIPPGRLRVRVFRGTVRSRSVNGERWVCVNDVRPVERLGRPRKGDD